MIELLESDARRKTCPYVSQIEHQEFPISLQRALWNLGSLITNLHFVSSSGNSAEKCPLPLPPYQHVGLYQWGSPLKSSGSCLRSPRWRVGWGGGDSPAGPSSQEEGHKPPKPRSSNGEMEEGLLAASHPRLLQQVGRGGACGSEQPQPSPGVETCFIPAPLPHCCPRRPRCFLASPSRMRHVAPRPHHDPDRLLQWDTV